MYLTGFADEAAPDIDGQIKALLTLGWKNIESRNVDGNNLHNISDEKFDTTCAKLHSAGIHINCYGSAIANWAKKIEDSSQSSYDELQRAITRMHRTGTKLIRVMSFAVPEDESVNDLSMAKEVIHRMKTLTKMAEDGGVILVHENCNNWGGRSYEHTLRLLDAIQSPNFRLVFDTGNPVFRLDIRGSAPYKYQDAFEYYRNVREFIEYVHIKDAIVKGSKTIFTYPGEGAGYVKEIMADLIKTGYDGGISIEPHLDVVAHDASVKGEAQVRFENFVEYGRRMEKMISSLK